MTDKDLDETIMAMRNVTALARLNLTECREVFAALQAKGWSPPAAGWVAPSPGAGS